MILTRETASGVKSPNFTTLGAVVFYHRPGGLMDRSIFYDLQSIGPHQKQGKGLLPVSHKLTDKIPGELFRESPREPELGSLENTGFFAIFGVGLASSGSF